jgi:hypothetical protein
MNPLLENSLHEGNIVAWRKIRMAKKVLKKRKASILDEAEDIVDEHEPQSALFYGRAGTGKTTLAATYPKPMLLLDIRERGTRSIIGVPGVKRIRVTEWEQLEEVYWALQEGSAYKTVCLDQLTAMQSLGMDHIREIAHVKEGDAFSQRNWGRLSGLMQQWIEAYRNLTDQGYNVIFNAHERVREPQEEDDDRIAPSVGSNLMGSVSSFVNGAVSVIGNTFIREVHDKKTKTREVQYCLRIGPHAYYAAKIRRPKSAGPTPDVIVDPSYEKIEKISQGGSLIAKVGKVKSLKRIK